MDKRKFSKSDALDVVGVQRNGVHQSALLVLCMRVVTKALFSATNDQSWLDARNGVVRLPSYSTCCVLASVEAFYNTLYSTVHTYF